ncbi:MAG: anaerobic ribonucleoside-triphosphate reductase activating protein [Christensenellales bacterium]
MQIAGFVKNSFVDYPGLIAAVVFVPGCNMDCWYCHNKSLWDAAKLLDTSEVLGFLKKRAGFIDGVVISGGEPTLQANLIPFIKKVKDLGYLIKLDTNGLLPQVVEKALMLTDYIALDIKAPPGQLSRVVSFDLDDSPIWRTADLLLSGAVEHEFRTTFIPLLGVDDISAIARRLQGAEKYVLQQYRKPKSVALQPDPHTAGAIKEAAKTAEGYVKRVIIRGL